MRQAPVRPRRARHDAARLVRCLLPARELGGLGQRPSPHHARPGPPPRRPTTTKGPAGWSGTFEQQSRRELERQQHARATRLGQRCRGQGRTSSTRGCAPAPADLLGSSVDAARRVCESVEASDRGGFGLERARGAPRGGGRGGPGSGETSAPRGRLRQDGWDREGAGEGVGWAERLTLLLGLGYRWANGGRVGQFVVRWTWDGCRRCTSHAAIMYEHGSFWIRLPCPRWPFPYPRYLMPTECCLFAGRPATRLTPTFGT